MSACDKIRRDLASGESGTELLRHLDRCPRCARFAADLKELWEAAGDLPCPAALPPQERPSQLRQAVPALAGVAVLIMILVALGSIWFPGKTAPKETAVAQRPTADSGLNKEEGQAQAHQPDLLQALSAARQVWTDETGEQWVDWLDLPESSPPALAQLEILDTLEVGGLYHRLINGEEDDPLSTPVHNYQTEVFQ